MTEERTATVSKRWTQPRERGDGTWIAELVDPDSAGPLQNKAFGPNADACARETGRYDQEWIASAARAGKKTEAEARLRFLLEDQAHENAAGGSE
jgi:hypothetical protein